MKNIGRREFLKYSGGTAGLLFLSTTLRHLPLSARDVPLFSTIPLGKSDGDKILWSQVQDEFPLKKGLVMLNAASLTPMPRKLSTKLNELAFSIDENPSSQHRDKFLDYYKEAVESLAQFINADFDEVAITRNTSESNNIVINGLELSSDDEVVIWEQNHPSNNLAWEQAAKLKGFKLVKVSTPKQPSSTEDLIAPFVDALNSKTRVLSITHVGNDTGVKLPVKSLVEIARWRRIFSLVDGAQSLGVLNINVKDIGMDCYTASLHKWPCGPRETGLLYLRKEVQEHISPSIVTVDFEEGPYLCSGRFSAFSQRNDAAIAVITDMVDFHHWIGKENIEERVLFLADALKGKLKEAMPSIEFITPRSHEMSAGIVVLRAPHLNLKTACVEFYNRFNIVLDTLSYEPDPFYNGIRLCPHLYNSMDQIDYVVHAIAQFSN